MLRVKYDSDNKQAVVLDDETVIKRWPGVYSKGWMRLPVTERSRLLRLCARIVACERYTYHRQGNHVAVYDSGTIVACVPRQPSVGVSDLFWAGPDQPGMLKAAIIRRALALAASDPVPATSSYRCMSQPLLPAPAKDPLEHMVTMVAALYPGPSAPGVQLALLPDGRWYAAVHSYAQSHGQARKVEHSHCASSKDAALRGLGERLLREAKRRITPAGPNDAAVGAGGALWPPVGAGGKIGGWELNPLGQDGEY